MQRINDENSSFHASNKDNKQIQSVPRELDQQLVRTYCDRALSDIDKIEKMKNLLAQGANANAVNSRGIPLLFIAAGLGEAEITELLLVAHANVNFTCCERDVTHTPLTRAAQLGHDKTVKLLLDYGADKEAICATKFTPLQLAASHGHINVVNHLLAHGVNIDAASNPPYDPTALYLAISRNNYEIARILLKHGANPNITHAGETSLYFLIERIENHQRSLLANLEEDDNKIVISLIAHGADLTLHPKEQPTIAELAQKLKPGIIKNTLEQALKALDIKERNKNTINNLFESIKKQRQNEVVELFELIKNLFNVRNDWRIAKHYEILTKIKQFIRNHTEEEINNIICNEFYGTNLFQFAAKHLELDDFITVLTTPSRDQQLADVRYRVARMDRRKNTLFRYVSSNCLFNFTFGLESRKILNYLNQHPETKDLRPDQLTKVLLSVKFKIQFNNNHADLNPIFKKLEKKIGTDDCNDKLVLHHLLKLAVKYEVIALIKTLVDMNEKHWIEPIFKGNTLLHYLAKSDKAIGAVIVPKSALRQIQTPIDFDLQKNAKGKTPLSLAIKAGSKAKKTKAMLLKYFQPAIAYLKSAIRSNRFWDIDYFIVRTNERDLAAIPFSETGATIFHYMAANSSQDQFDSHLKFLPNARKRFQETGSFQLARRILQQDQAGKSVLDYMLTKKQVTASELEYHLKLRQDAIAALPPEETKTIREHQAQYYAEILVQLQQTPTTELAEKTRLLIKHGAALKAEQFEAVQSDPKALEKLATWLVAKAEHAKEPREKQALINRALFHYLLALDIAEEQGDRKQQATIKQQIYRIKRSSAAHGANELIKIANLKTALSLKKELASMSIFNLPGRMKAFNVISQLAKNDINIKLVLADCYYENLAPAMQFNQRGKAIAIYRELQNKSFYAEWMIKQIELGQTPHRDDAVHDALLSSLRLLGSHEPNKDKALAYIKQCKTHFDLKLRCFAQMLEGVVSENPALSKQAFAALKDCGELAAAQQMLSEIKFTIESSEHRATDEMESVVEGLRQNHSISSDSEEVLEECLSEEEMTETMPLVQLPVTVASPSSTSMSFAYLELHKEKEKEQQEKYEQSASYLRLPEREENEKAEKAKKEAEKQAHKEQTTSLRDRLNAFRLKTPITASNEIEMEDLEKRREQAVIKSIDKAPAAPTSLLSSIVTYFSPNKIGKNQGAREEKKQKQPLLAG